jgi:hypothetical protein
MKNNILHSLSIAALIALSASVVSADIFTLISGTAYNGKIFKILEGQVTIDVAGG